MPTKIDTILPIEPIKISNKAFDMFCDSFCEAMNKIKYNIWENK